MDKISLIGLGNILLRDEGVGVHALNTIKERYFFSPTVELIDGGTLGLDLLPFLEKGDKILFLDAVDFGGGPGFVGELEGDEIPSALRPRLSVHHIGLSDLLQAAKWMDIKPAEICLMGIQPDSVETGLEMTEQVSSRMEELIDRVIKKLRGWNIRCVLRSP